MSTTEVVKSDTTTFRLNASRNGVVWDISGATVTLKLRKPSGTLLTLSAAVIDGPNGIAQYTTSTSTIDEEGDWERQWTVAVSGVSLSSAPINFPVLELLI